jgi:ABC-type transport system involved in multi-copper enzyme maturation permease subunit
LIMVLSIVMALWTASTSIADEIEGRTALTLLSKPVGRREFILGKFVGILVPVAIMFLVLGALFLASVSYKVVYDARETAQSDPTLLDCQQEMLQIAPGLALAFM